MSTIYKEVCRDQEQTVYWTLLPKSIKKYCCVIFNVMEEKVDFFTLPRSKDGMRVTEKTCGSIEKRLTGKNCL